MQKVMMPVFYMPPLSWFAEFLKRDTEVVLEQYESFPKQTYRNRANIYGANGKLSLIIPIQHSEDKLYKNTQVSNAVKWQAQHWKSIESAYKGSPYFDYYEYKLKALFTKEVGSLLEFNLRFLDVVLSILKTDKTYQLSEDYMVDFDGIDLRNGFSTKESNQLIIAEYYQTFSEKHGFIPDLSILDLICNNGPESATYLKSLNSK